MKKRGLLLTLSFFILCLSGCQSSNAGDYNNNNHKHTWDVPTYVWSEDNSKCTGIAKCIDDETHILEKTVDTTHQINKAATCTEDGKETFNAWFPSPFSYQEKIVIIPAFGHDYEIEYEWYSDYSRCVAILICKNNSKHNKRVYSTRVDVDILKEVTEREDGLVRYTAFFNDDVSQTSTEIVNHATGSVDKLIFERISFGSFGYIVREKSKMISGVVNIPAFYNGMKVYGIKSNSFNNCPLISEIYISEGVEYLGLCAFRCLPYLKTVYLPDSLIFDDPYNESFFTYCTSLTNIRWPNGIKRIPSAFAYCVELKQVIIPDTVEEIGCSFIGCYQLNIVEIGENVQTIEEEAFKDCFSLFEVVNKSSLNIVAGEELYGHIAKYAKSILSDINESKIKINDKGFVTYHTEEDDFLIGYCGTSRYLEIPNYLTKVNPYLFCYSNRITYVKMPLLAHSIENATFFGSSLSSIDFSNVTIVGNGTRNYQTAFYDCLRLNSVPSKFSYCFDNGGNKNGCRNLVEELEDGQESKVSVDQNGVVTFKNNDSVTVVGYRGTLKNIIIPNDATAIKEYCFAERPTIGNRFTLDFESITFGKNIKNIGKRVFENNFLVKDIYFQGTKAEWDSIEKEEDWNLIWSSQNIYIESVHCTDGDVVL